MRVGKQVVDGFRKMRLIDLCALRIEVGRLSSGSSSKSGDSLHVMWAVRQKPSNRYLEPKWPVTSL